MIYLDNQIIISFQQLSILINQFELNCQQSFHVLASCEFASLSFDKSDNDGQENNSIKVPFIQNAFPYKIQYGGFSSRTSAII